VIDSPRDPLTGHVTSGAPSSSTEPSCWRCRCGRDGFERQQEAAQGGHGFSDGEHEFYQAADQSLVQRIYGTYVVVVQACCLSNAMRSIGQSLKLPERPSVRPCVRASVQLLRRHISIMVQDRRIVTMDHL